MNNIINNKNVIKNNNNNNNIKNRKIFSLKYYFFSLLVHFRFLVTSMGKVFIDILICLSL